MPRPHKQIVGLRAEVRALNRLRNPRARLARATDLLAELRQADQAISQTRDRAITSLHVEHGWTCEEIARIAGLSRGRVGQITQRLRSDRTR